MAHTYEIIGEPDLEREYCDEWGTTMVFTLRRDDGKQDTIWVTAGVPDYQRGSSQAAGHRMGFEDVNAFEGNLTTWCGQNLYDDLRDEDGDLDSGMIADEKDAMLATVHDIALANQIEAEA